MMERYYAKFFPSVRRQYAAMAAPTLMVEGRNDNA
jgi:hypothetical protein